MKTGYCHIYNHKMPLDSITDRLHIGNRWLGHLGLAMYAEIFATHIENKIRAEQSLPLRTYYSVEEGIYKGRIINKKMAPFCFMTVRKKRIIKNLKKNRFRLNMGLNRHIKYLGCLTVFLFALMMPFLLNARKVGFPGNCKLTEIEAVYTDCRFDSFAVKDMKLSEDKWVKKRLNTFLPFFDGIYDPKSDTLLIFSSFYHILPNEKIYVETPNDGILQLIERPSPRNNNKWYYEKSPYVPVKLPPGHIEESDVLVYSI